MDTSPRNNERKILDSHVFGSKGKIFTPDRLSKQKKKSNAKISMFMSEAEQTEEVNSMLIEAIKAKLAILDSMDD